MADLAPCVHRKNAGKIGDMASNRSKASHQSSDPRLEELDIRLLAELQNNGRLSLAGLGRRLGLSATTVAERMQRLEERAVIRAYRADIDPRKVGYALSVIIRIRPSPGQVQAVAELVKQTPEVAECHRITGEDCYIATVHLRDTFHLEEVVDRFAVLGQTTTTSLMHSSPVADRGPRLPIVGD